MKKFFILILLWASNEIQAQSIFVSAEYYVVNTDGKLNIIDRFENKILFSAVVNTSTVTESIFLSSDKSKIWYLSSSDYYFIDTKTWKSEKKISGVNVYAFNPSSDKNYFVYTHSGDEFTSEIYDANTGELYKSVSYVANAFIGDVMYDEISKKLYQISSTFSSESETVISSSNPETLADLEAAMKNDGKKVELLVYDLAMGNVAYKEEIYYSPQFHFSFEYLKEQLYIISAMGTAMVNDDYQIQLLPVITGGNLRAYGVDKKGMIGFTFFDLFKYEFATKTFTSVEEYHDGLLSSLAVFSANGIEYYFLGESEILVFNSNNLLTPTRTISIPKE